MNVTTHDWRKLFSVVKTSSDGDMIYCRACEWSVFWPVIGSPKPVDLVLPHLNQLDDVWEHFASIIVGDGCDR